MHILNRSPTLAVKNITPEEALSGLKPTVDHFRIFGCVAYMHAPDTKRRKLDPKGEKCILLGVSEESKAYHLYNPTTKKIHISRDMVFDENNSWNCECKDKEERITLDFDDKEESDDEDNVANDLAETNQDDNESEEAETSLVNTQRTRRPPIWMSDYTSGEEISDDNIATHHVLFSENDPITFEEAIKGAKWRKAMDAEIEAIERNNTWELVVLPKEEKPVGVKWICKTKLNEKGEVEKFKARLVAKGYTQEYGVDYSEVYASVAKHDTIRMIISLAATNEWTIFQLDLKSAFLHGKLEEQAFIDQPPGYEKKESKNMVYRLKKALYRLKQAPRAWYSRIDTHFVNSRFNKCPYEHTLYIKIGNTGNILIVCLYVDDLIFTGNDEDMFKEFKESMMHEFEMTDFGKMKYFLGIEATQSAEGIFICQKNMFKEF